MCIRDRFEPGDIPSVVKWVCETLPDDRPRHLLGMGAQPADLFLGVEPVSYTHLRRQYANPVAQQKSKLPVPEGASSRYDLGNGHL